MTSCCFSSRKRLFSSPSAFATTLAAHLRTLAAPRPAVPPDRERVRAAYEETDDDFALDDDLDDATEEALLIAARASESVTPEERVLLDRLRMWSSRAATRADAKAETSVARLREWCQRPSSAGKMVGPTSASSSSPNTVRRERGSSAYSVKTGRGRTRRAPCAAIRRHG